KLIRRGVIRTQELAVCEELHLAHAAVAVACSGLNKDGLPDGEGVAGNWASDANRRRAVAGLRFDHDVDRLGGGCVAVAVGGDSRDGMAADRGIRPGNLPRGSGGRADQSSSAIELHLDNRAIRVISL